MPTIDIISKISYYNSAAASNSGTAGSTPQPNATDAKDAAKSAAQAQANAAVIAPDNGGSSSTQYVRFGSSSSLSTSIGTPTSSYKAPYYYGSCTWSATRTTTMFQTKLAFQIPSGLTAANIDSATITFTATAEDTNETTYNLCAPKTTSDLINYQKRSTTTIIDIDKKVTFDSPGNTNAKSYSLTITDIFKQCITNNQGWVVILYPADSLGAYRSMLISGTPQITYTESYSNCGAPTSVQVSTDGTSYTSSIIQKPSGTISIKWSGAGAGNNNPIAGYTVYYKAGGNPTVSSNDGSANVNANASSYLFTIPSNATRGSTYYFKVLTRGNVSGYDSNISTASANTKVNSLPAAPTVSASPTRIKSTVSSTNKVRVTFTVTAGNTNDTGQTASLYYATSATGTKTSFASPLNQDLSGAATYYFWTYDGLEYSSSYASQSIIKNTPPTISSITMSARSTYSPSVRDGYVENIDGTAAGVTGNNVTYQWKLCVGSGTTATSYGTVTNISTTTSLSNIDVTSYGATFNTAYRLALTVTDDLGESATAYSSTIYAIPAAPTISSIYNQRASSNRSGTNSSHFDDGIRIVYSENNTGITRELQYSTNSNFNSFSTLSISGTSQSDATLTSLTRGTTYYFRVKYICNTKTTTSAVSSGYMRANDITPNISSITQQSGNAIKPYTQSLLNFSFTNSPTSWTNTQDVATSYESIYSIKFKYSTRSLSVTSSGENSNGTVTGTVTLSSITTANWKTLLGLTDAPNTSYNITLEITATNNFGATFVSSRALTVNFVEGIASIGTVELQIKTGSSTYTKIPDGYNNQASLDRYRIFEGQVLRLYLNGLTCYANQTATVYFMDGNTSLGSTTIASNQWTAPSGTNRLYTLNTAKTIDYTVPANISPYYTPGLKNFSIKVVLYNGSFLTSEGTNLKSCFHMRFAPASIDFKINSADDSNQEWSCTDWGGSGESPNKFSLSYSSIQIQENYSTSSNGSKTYIGSLDDVISSPGSGIFNNSLTSVIGDILYLGAQVIVTLKYQPVVYPADFTAISPIPINSLNVSEPTNHSYTYYYNNSYAYYRATPNLLYGKNFFCLNQNSPVSGRADQVLEISTARDDSVSPEVTRNSIYFGTDGSKFVITDNGLVIDCGSW